MKNAKNVEIFNKQTLELPITLDTHSKRISGRHTGKSPGSDDICI